VRKGLLFVGLALTLAGCMNAADTKKADDATDAFYRQVAAKQYQAIYDGASTDLRAAIPSDTFVGMMQQIDQVMGACGAPKKRASLNVSINNGVTTRSQGYTRTCTGGELNERVTIVIRNGEAKLAGYHFGPDADSGSGNE